MLQAGCQCCSKQCLEDGGQGYVLLVDVELTLSRILATAFQYGRLYLSLVAFQVRSRCL